MSTAKNVTILSRSLLSTPPLAAIPGRVTRLDISLITCRVASFDAAREHLSGSPFGNTELPCKRQAVKNLEKSRLLASLALPRGSFANPRFVSRSAEPGAQVVAIPTGRPILVAPCRCWLLQCHLCHAKLAHEGRLFCLVFLHACEDIAKEIESQEHMRPLVEHHAFGTP